MARYAAVLLMVCLATLDAAAQAPKTQPQPGAASPPQAPMATQLGDPAAQMRLDLNEMEGLVNNLAAQTNFIRDTNLSILLNTNVRLWRVLLRDLRMQLDAQPPSPQPARSAPR